MKKIFYRVKKDDTLFCIAQRFNVSVFSIIKENLLNQEVEEGDMLVIDSNQSTYKVLPLENLKDIAKKLNISEQELIELNGIDEVFYGAIIKVKDE